jgi:hypothetical protein
VPKADVRDVVVGSTGAHDMAKEYDPEFSETVNALEVLSHLYQKGVFKKERVEEIVRSLMAEMTEEQLDVYVEYQRERERQAVGRAEDLKKALSQLEAERDRRRNVMTNEQLRAEMKVLVDVEGVLKPAKVIGPTTLRKGDKITITGWVVHIEPSGLPHTTTADKIHPRT